MEKKEFTENFNELMSIRRDDMRARFNRVLPSGEYIFNRFDKAEYLNCGEGSSIYDTSIVMGNVKIGSHVWIGPYTLLDGYNAKLEIGDYVSIDAGVMIYTHDTTKNYISGGREPVVLGDVTIGNNTVIGTMSMIGCGVTIGNHCVIGAHSYVNIDIPDYCIAAGNPAKIIGIVKIDEDGKVEFLYK